MKFYLSSDGFIDQKGGEKGFSFGKKRFKQLIVDWYKDDFCEQKEIFMIKLGEYQNDYFRIDDITVFGWRV
jgi:serine phosphatase RsbU (regulator of sigma subunit)